MTAACSVTAIMEALSYVGKFRNYVVLIKIGGSLLNTNTVIASLCQDLQLLKNAGIKIILVHGGSKAINEHLNVHQIPSEFVDGLRITSGDAIKVIEMVLCGHVNKLLVRKLNSIGLPAIGLSGSDQNMLQCETYSKQHGFVGTVKHVNPQAILDVLAFQHPYEGAIPVIAPIGVDENGNALNINADVAACEIAMALKVDKLIYLTDQDGIYNEKGEVFSEIKEEELNALVAKGVVTQGMLVKVNAILAALQSNLKQVHILNGHKPHILIEELLTVSGVGTLCKKQNDQKEAI